MASGDAKQMVAKARIVELVAKDRSAADTTCSDVEEPVGKVTARDSWHPAKLAACAVRS
jgi:hypothetical protein